MAADYQVRGAKISTIYKEPLPCLVGPDGTGCKHFSDCAKGGQACEAFNVYTFRGKASDDPDKYQPTEKTWKKLFPASTH